MWYLYLKTLFCYLLDIYCNELKFIYPNDLVFKRLNSNKTQHQISLQKANDIWCNFFRLLGNYVILIKCSSQKANENSLWKELFGFRQFFNQTPIWLFWLVKTDKLLQKAHVCKKSHSTKQSYVLICVNEIMCKV